MTAPSGVVFNSATFGQVLWQLSDPAGIDWDSTSASMGHNHIYASLRAGYRQHRGPLFPAGTRRGPGRRLDRADMLLQVSLPDNSTRLCTPFMGAAGT